MHLYIQRKVHVSFQRCAKRRRLLGGQLLCIDKYTRILRVLLAGELRRAEWNRAWSGV